MAMNRQTRETLQTRLPFRNITREYLHSACVKRYMRLTSLLVSLVKTGMRNVSPKTCLVLSNGCSELILDAVATTSSPGGSDAGENSRAKCSARISGLAEAFNCVSTTRVYSARIRNEPHSQAREVYPDHPR